MSGCTWAVARVNQRCALPSCGCMAYLMLDMPPRPLRWPPIGPDARLPSKCVHARCAPADHATDLNLPSRPATGFLCLAAQQLRLCSLRLSGRRSRVRWQLRTGTMPSLSRSVVGQAHDGWAARRQLGAAQLACGAHAQDDSQRCSSMPPAVRDRVQTICLPCFLLAGSGDR